MKAKKQSAWSIFTKRKNSTVKANKEVILSAGAINSPQILMNSGIGDSKDLMKHGIEIVHEAEGSWEKFARSLRSG